MANAEQAGTVIKFPGSKAQHCARMMRYLPSFEPRVIIDAFCGSSAFGLAARQQFPNATLQGIEKRVRKLLVLKRDWLDLACPHTACK